MRFNTPCKKTNNYQKQPKLLDFAIDHGDMKIQLQWYNHPHFILMYSVQCIKIDRKPSFNGQFHQLERK